MTSSKFLSLVKKLKWVFVPPLPPPPKHRYLINLLSFFSEETQTNDKFLLD
jgi:hypothetical protein